jgi:hypothetical protein
LRFLDYYQVIVQEIQVINNQKIFHPNVE